LTSSTRSTRASRYAKACAEVLPAALAACLALSTPGCSSSAQVAAEYDSLRPRAIAVHPVVNETIHQLDAVTFGGLLQRITLGPAAVNVPEVLRGGLEEALLLGDYASPPYARPPGEPESSIPIEKHRDITVRPDRQLPEAWASLPFDAVLVPVIETWQATTTTGTPAADIRYRVIIYRLPGLEVLYSNVFEGSYREDVRTRSAEGVPAWIRRSARKVLADLPAGS